MSLARGARALAQLAASCSGAAPAQPLSSWLRPAQQLTSLWGYAPAQGFAASAAAPQAEPAAAAAAAPQPLPLPDVFVRLEQRISERYSVPPKRVFAVVEVGGTQYKVRPAQGVAHRAGALPRCRRRRRRPCTQPLLPLPLPPHPRQVTPNDVIVVEKLDVDVNDTLQLRRVLLLGSTAETVIGRPYVTGGAVTAAVEEQFLDGKVLIFHKRRRKNSRRLRGHRQVHTGRGG